MKALSEILLHIETLQTEKERVEFLQKMPNIYQAASRIIFKYMFDPAVKFRLPEGAPPYEASGYDNPAVLIKECGRLYIFVEGGHPTVTDRKREQIFVEMLCNVIPTDAELLIAMKEKRSPYSGLTKGVVKKAFPGIFE